jgi:hypothetical protein
MSEREREEWTEEDERKPEGDPDELMTSDGEDVALSGIDDLDQDIDPEIAEELRLLDEAEEEDEAG